MFEAVGKKMNHASEADQIAEVFYEVAIDRKGQVQCLSG